MLGFGQLDHLQLDAVGGRGLDGLFAGVALIHIGQFHVLFARCLYLLGETFDLRTLLSIGGRDHQCKEIAQRVDGHMHLDLAPVLRSTRSAGLLMF